MKTSTPKTQRYSSKRKIGMKWDAQNNKWIEVDLASPAEKSTVRKTASKASAGSPSRKTFSKPSTGGLSSSELCCYANTLSGFWKEPSKEAWINKMKNAYKRNVAFAKLPQSQEQSFAWKCQIRAWEDCFDTMQELKKRCLANPKFRKYGYFGIIFEYLLPTQSGENRGYGKRPDVLLICDNFVWVLEFKTGTGAPGDNAEQVLEYANYLKKHHRDCSDKEIIPMLVYTGTTEITKELKSRIGDKVHACPSIKLADEIEKFSPKFIQEINYKKWIQARFD